MTEMINNVIEELKQIFKYEKPTTKEIFISDDWTEEEFIETFGKKTLFIINCIFIPRNDNDVIHLHYDLNYCGSNDFLKILKKYNLGFDWYDNCRAIVFKKQE